MLTDYDLKPKKVKIFFILLFIGNFRIFCAWNLCQAICYSKLFRMSNCQYTKVISNKNYIVLLITDLFGVK